eukprot:782293-Pelagomonas_calceolata.AAC.2
MTPAEASEAAESALDFGAKVMGGPFAWTHGVRAQLRLWCLALRAQTGYPLLTVTLARVTYADSDDFAAQFHI